MNSKVMMVLAGIMLFGAIIAGYLGYKASAQPEVAQKKSAPVDANGVAQDLNRPTNQAGLYGVVVAANDLVAHHKITADDVYIEYLKQVPPGTFSSKDAVVGKRPYMAISAGSLLTEATVAEGGKIPQLIKSGERAIAISVDEVIGGGGHIRPGDSVDVLLFTKDQNSTRDNHVDNSAAQIVTTNVRVISYGQRIAKTDSELAPKAEGEQEQKEQANDDNSVARSAVLAIPHNEVSKLVLASNIGVLRLAVRSAEESATQITDPMFSNSPAASESFVGKQLITASALLPSAHRARTQPSTVAQQAPVRRATPAASKKTVSTTSASKESAIVIQRGSAVQSVNL